MNKHSVELLEKHFDTAFAAPDGIKKLRELILTLAMRGQLVPQDPSDPPASELLKEIEAEKQRLIKDGKIKKPKLLPPVTEEEKPYALPQGWEWVRLGDIGLINPRNIANDYVLAGFVPMPLIQEGYSEFHSFEKRRWSEIKKGYTHFANGDVGMAKITPCFENGKSCVFSNLPSGIGAGTTELHIFRNIFAAVDPRYLLFFLKNPKFISVTATKMTGSAGQKRVPTPLFTELVFPLPPIPEQHRIVAKIDELMARCDELEKLHTTQQEQRLAVHAAAIKQLLNIAEPGQHQRAQTFLAEHFDKLYNVKENVAELRKAILQLAMMGKLVTQDMPTSLIELRNLTTKIGSGSTPSGGRNAYKKVGIPLIRSMNVHFSGFKYEGLAFIDNDQARKLNHVIVEAGDILLNITGASIGRVTHAPIEMHGARVNQHVCIIRPKDKVLSRYLEFCLASPLIQNRIFNVQVGATREALTKSMIENFVIPLPPLPEQHRIVAKIDELMTLCDSLDQQIEAATAKQAELLNSLMFALSQDNTAGSTYQSPPALPQGSISQQRLGV